MGDNTGPFAKTPDEIAKESATAETQILDENHPTEPSELVTLVSFLPQLSSLSPTSLHACASTTSCKQTLMSSRPHTTFLPKRQEGGVPSTSQQLERRQRGGRRRRRRKEEEKEEKEKGRERAKRTN